MQPSIGKGGRFPVGWQGPSQTVTGPWSLRAMDGAGLLQLAAVGVEEQPEQDRDQEHHERDLPGAVGALALDQAGTAVDAQAVHLAAVAERAEPGRQQDVL